MSQTATIEFGHVCDALLQFIELPLATEDLSGVRLRPDVIIEDEDEPPLLLLREWITYQPLFGTGNMETVMASALADLVLPLSAHPHVTRFRDEGWNAVETPDGGFIAISPYAPIEFLPSF